MTRGTSVLVVDDEPPIRRLLRTSLGAQDFEVFEAPDAATAFARVAEEKPEIVLLDLSLPDLDGTEVIRRLRSQGNRTPIIVLSSRGNEKGKVEALDLGADDYVTKPFGMAELVARIRAALRHRVQEQGGDPIFRSGDLTVDLTRRRVLRGGEEVKLSPKEYDILRLLVLHAGKVLTHMFLHEALGRGRRRAVPARLRRQLRQKLESDPGAAAPYTDGNRHRLSAQGA